MHSLVDEPFISSTVWALYFEAAVAQAARNVTCRKPFVAENPETDLTNRADKEQEFRRKFLHLLTYPVQPDNVGETHNC